MASWSEGSVDPHCAKKFYQISKLDILKAAISLLLLLIWRSRNGTVCCLSEKSTKVLKVQCKHSYYFYWSIVDLQCCISFYVQQSISVIHVYFSSCSFPCAFLVVYYRVWVWFLCYTVGAYCLKIWTNASRICVSFLCRDCIKLLCIVAILIYVLPKQALEQLFFNRFGFFHYVS